MPDFTTASAMLLIMSSLTLHANLFHEFHPMGGVSARLAEGAGVTCASRVAARNITLKQVYKERCFDFMGNVVSEVEAIWYSVAPASCRLSGRRPCPPSSEPSMTLLVFRYNSAGRSHARIPKSHLALICFGRKLRCSKPIHGWHV